METKQGERTTFADADRPVWAYGRGEDAPQLGLADDTGKRRTLTVMKRTIALFPSWGFLSD